MACKQTKIIGRDVVMEVAIGCGDRLPLESEWARLGSMRTKEFSIEWDSADATADDSVGAIREMLATFQSLTMSGDGTVKVSGGGAANLIELTKHVAQPEATGGQPNAWFRMTFPDLTFTAYMMISTLSRSAPYDDVVTYSLEASATASDFGLIVDDTPDPDAPAATSVAVVPATFTLPAGDSFNVEAVVLPVKASQVLRWTSSAPAVASVNPISGIVTAISAGTATITATSDTAGITGTSTITVVPVVAGVSVAPTAVAIEVGDTESLTASVTPTGATTGFLYTSANPGIASVSTSGVITGVAPGTTSVKVASASRPSVSTTIPVTVTA